MTDQDTTVPDPFEEFASQTPAEYAGMSPNISEAGGVAWCDVYTPDGFKISLTERRNNGVDAFNALMYVLNYARQRYGITPMRPQAQTQPDVIVTAPAPSTPTPIAASPISAAKGHMTVRVNSVKHIKKKGPEGKHMVVVNASEFPEGALAFDKQMPVGIDWMNWQLFQEYQPPVEMSYAVIDPAKKWVIEFRSQPV